MTAHGREHAGGIFPAELISGENTAAQADGLRMLLSMAVRESRPPWDETPVRDEQLLTVGRTAVLEPEHGRYSRRPSPHPGHGQVENRDGARPAAVGMQLRRRPTWNAVERDSSSSAGLGVLSSLSASACRPC